MLDSWTRCVRPPVMVLVESASQFSIFIEKLLRAGALRSFLASNSATSR